ncbi:large exoprotein [Microbacterium aquilitoris]|uniref:large exoprotein n=1 Tax=Microbacterium aquilitoris TaxID=3067307 RepID=UPI00288F2335|nr:large exoprotein [Microbacterium sp. KSW2-22]MDT3344418.1 large exoprotein [Microbacterium sp. KSW2-22]
MGEQVMGGGVIVLVAVLLWLLYLLPSWHSRHQYQAAERNAVRLNQALRVLAETSETPGEVRLELNARTALAQQKLARRVQAEKESVGLEAARAELAAAKAQAAVDRELAKAEQRQAAADAAARREKARADAALARERAIAEAAAARATPAVRRARTRRRVRLTASVVGVLALGVTGFGGYLGAIGAGWTLLVAGGAVALSSLLVLGRMNAVARRAASRSVEIEVVREASPVQDVVLESDRVEWTPRTLPRPLTASAGSRAAAVLDASDARDALRQAAVEEALRERVAQAAPPSIDTARRTRAAEVAFAGPADDERIEAHVRDLLARRASGQ